MHVNTLLLCHTIFLWCIATVFMHFFLLTTIMMTITDNILQEMPCHVDFF